MAPVRPLVDTLFAEMKGRMKEDDSSVPRKDGDWLYWWAFRTGAQYRCWWRRRADGSGGDEVLLDEAGEAEGHDYFRLGALAVSPDGRLLAWTADASGAERFTLRIRDLATGADIETVSSIVNGAVVWGAGSDVVAYTEVNDNWRTFRARAHRLGSDPARRSDAVRGDRRHRLQRASRPDARPPVDHRRHQRSRDQRAAPAACRRSRRRAAAGLAAPGEAPIQHRLRARKIVGADQRRSRQFPPRLGRPRDARRVDDGDRRIGQRLSARRHQLRAPSRHRGARRRARSDPAARL